MSSQQKATVPAAAYLGNLLRAQNGLLLIPRSRLNLIVQHGEIALVVHDFVLQLLRLGGGGALVSEAPTARRWARSAALSRGMHASGKCAPQQSRP